MSIPVRRPLAAMVGVISLAVGAAMLAVSPARSVPPPADAQCPQAYPVGDLVKGQPVDGLTVSSGTAPDTFTGTVLGTITDGIAAGLDMIVVRLSSPEIDRVGGIWEGMSGSPVYAADGRLIGAVSYGLAFGSSPVAGVTPAGEMQALLTTAPSPQPQPRLRVSVPARIQARMVAGGAASEQAASSGLQRLAVPVGVSGLSSARLGKAAARLHLGDVRLYRAAPAVTAPLAGDGQIFAGSNLAASLSYGDLSAVGTGTTTMVCGDTVVGFGHPFSFSGDTSMTMHGASVVYVQEDPLGVPFKVSNPTGPVGVVDEDRMAGIKGELGAAPASTLVHTVVTGPRGRSRTGDTRVSVPDFASTATALGLLANIDRVFDHTGKGSSYVRFTISGHTSTGTPFTLTRANRFADAVDASYASILEPPAAVDALLGNDFTAVTLDQVRIDASMSDQVRAFHVARVQVRVRHAWRTVGPDSVIRARHGRDVVMRAVLRSRRDELGSKLVTVRLHVPGSAPRGDTGVVQVGAVGGDGSGDGSGDPALGGGPTSFGQLLRSLRTAPRNDQLSVSLQLSSSEDGTPAAQTTAPAGDVVTGAAQFMLRIR